ncbi:MAG: PspC domain-containing protein [Eubacteriales bacterium]|nr:PspC domain-containing protein [Eubacteriales bacterium]
MEKKLYKSSNDKVLAGVCGGIGEYFAVDTVIIRLLWVVFTLMGGAGLIAYIIAAIIIPSNPVYSTIEDDDRRMDDTDTRDRPERKDSSRSTSIVLGAILVMFGAFVLAKDFIPWIPRDVFLAAILIGLGIFFLVRKK